MTREQAVARQAQIEQQRFMLAMKDNWNGSDFRYDYDLLQEYLKLDAIVKETN